MHQNASLDDAMSRTQTTERYLRLKYVQTPVEDFERSGRPLSSRTNENTTAEH
jgi:hypothetical protein